MQSGFSVYISEKKIQIDTFLTKGYDSFEVENDEVKIIFEGVLLNKKALLQSYALADFQTLALELYRQKKENIITLFEGEFRGIILNKSTQKCMLFTNPTSTQRIFYGNFDGKFFADSNLVRFSQTVKMHGISAKPNIDGIYQLLCFNGLLQNYTIISDVYKILDGHFLTVDISNNQFQESEYFSTFNEPYFGGSKEKAFQRADEIFSEAITMEYSKDDEYQSHHLALLSGGLDSRVAMMYAMKNGFKPDNALCFSQSGYFDETISRKIAGDYNIHYEFIPLDGGSFLKKIDQLTELSEGLVFYTGGIHVQHAMDHLKYENFKIFHSGQIGDGILGGFNSQPKRNLPSTFKLMYNADFFSKVEQTFQKTVQNYETEESFLIRNLAYNKVLFGAHVFQQKAYQTSPFMGKDFLKLAISLSESWKFNHRFYIEWISKYCPEATKYRWERTLMRPNAVWKTFFGDQLVKRIFIKTNEWILKTPQKSSMYPYQYYFDRNPDIQHYYQHYFEENINRLDAYPDLKSEMIQLFSNVDFNKKVQAINVLAIFKLYF